MAKLTGITKSTGNVFNDLGFNVAEAENLLVRSKLMIEIKLYIEKNGLTQAKAAKVFGVPQPRISEICQASYPDRSCQNRLRML